MPQVKLDAVTTSVSLERKHLAFLKRLNLNLSRLIRDYIDVLIKEGEQTVQQPAGDDSKDQPE